MREDPTRDPLIPIDLRPEKERLIKVCELGDIRLGRLFALGSWGDAVWVAKQARDLRGIALLSWALDPTVDLSGKRRAAPLSESELEEKLMSYDKRLDELDESDILANLGLANFERRGDLLVVDVLENDGTWDVRKSHAVEVSVAAIDQFSMIIGAQHPSDASGKGAGKNGERARASAPTTPSAAGGSTAESADAQGEPVEDLAASWPLRVAEVGEGLVVIFPKERFDLDVAAAIGKRDWESILKPTDQISGPQRDRIYRDGAGFMAPLEFLSEVFVDGKPLSRPHFDSEASTVGDVARTLEAHLPRFGSVLLVALSDGRRFVCSQVASPETLLPLVEQQA